MLSFFVKRCGTSCIVFISTLCVSCEVLAQEVSFTPRFDSIDADTKYGRTESQLESDNSRSSAGALYSFGRFQAQIDWICEGMQSDLRASRLAEIAAESLQSESLAPTARALLKEFESRCGSRMRTLRRVRSRDDTPKTLHDVPYPSRFPSTETLDATSRLSVALYSQAKGGGGMYVAVRRFSSIVLSYRGLNRGEIDYYSTFFKFLEAAWMDRKQTDQYQRLATREESNNLFQ